MNIWRFVTKLITAVLLDVIKVCMFIAIFSFTIDHGGFWWFMAITFTLLESISSLYYIYSIIKEFKGGTENGNRREA